jgi:hypothetical protein
MLSTISIGICWVSAQEAGDDRLPSAHHTHKVEVLCPKEGVICSSYTPLKFGSKNTTRYAGYIREIRRLPPGARRPSDPLDGHRITVHHPADDIYDSDHYSLYRLCFDVDESTHECRQVIQPQPEIGQIHPEVSDPKRMPYNLLIDDLHGIHKEVGSDKAQYLTINLWMQENREPTAWEEKLFRGKPPPTNVSTVAELVDGRFNQVLPTTYFVLQYRFVENGDEVSFEATPETKDVIKNIRDKTTIRKN